MSIDTQIAVRTVGLGKSFGPMHNINCAPTAVAACAVAADVTGGHRRRTALGAAGGPSLFGKHQDGKRGDHLQRDETVDGVERGGR